MNKFPERLSELMKERRLNITELASLSGVGKSSISAYLNREYNPKQKAVYALAKYFNVSEAYLMGWIDNREYSISGDNNIVNTAEHVSTFIQGNRNDLGENNTFTINEAVKTENTVDDTVEKQNKSIKLQQDNEDIQNKMLEVLIGISNGINETLKMTKENNEVSKSILKQMHTGNVVQYSNLRSDYASLNIYGSISAGTGLDLYDEIVETIEYPLPIPDHDIALKVNGDSMYPLYEDGEVVFLEKTVDKLRHGQIGAFTLNGEGFLKKYYDLNGVVKLVSLNKNYEDIIIKENDDLRVVGIRVV